MRAIQFLVIVMLTMTLFFTAPLSSYALDNPPLPKPVGRVVWVKGQLSAVMANQETRILQKTSVIYEKDTLVTDEHTQAQIVFTDNTLMTFKEGTKFFVDQYSYNPASKKKSVGKYVMNLIEGGFRTVTGLIAKRNPTDYQVNTPVATIGVRGTDYAVSVVNGELYVGYYTGEPCVKGKGRNGQTLCLDAKNQYGKVAGDGAAPVPLSQRPEALSQKLEVVPVKISSFISQESQMTSQDASSGVELLPQSSGSGSAPISSFCISQ